MRLQFNAPIIPVICGLCALLSSPTLVASQELNPDDRPFRIGPTIGGVFFLSGIAIPQQFQDVVRSAGFSDTFGLGLEAGYRVSDRWELGFSFLDAVNSDFTAVSTTGIAVSTEQDVAGVGLNVIYYILPTTPVQPFVTAGAGTKTTDLDDLTGGNVNFDPAVKFGAGVAAPVTTRFSVRFAARDFVSWYDEIEEFDTSVQHDLWLTTGGYLHF